MSNDNLPQKGNDTAEIISAITDLAVDFIDKQNQIKLSEKEIEYKMFIAEQAAKQKLSIKSANFKMIGFTLLIIGASVLAVLDKLDGVYMAALSMFATLLMSFDNFKNTGAKPVQKNFDTSTVLKN